MGSQQQGHKALAVGDAAAGVHILLQKMPRRLERLEIAGVGVTDGQEAARPYLIHVSGLHGRVEQPNEIRRGFR